MALHKIGIADSDDRTGPHFDGHDLLIMEEPVPKRNKWWRSPLVGLLEPGWKNLGAVSVVWGTPDEILAQAKTLPHKVVVAVSQGEQPKDLPARFEWVTVSGPTAVRVEVLTAPGSAEVRVYDLLNN